MEFNNFITRTYKLWETSHRLIKFVLKRKYLFCKVRHRSEMTFVESLMSQNPSIFVPHLLWGINLGKTSVISNFVCCSWWRRKQNLLWFWEFKSFQNFFGRFNLQTVLPVNFTYSVLPTLFLLLRSSTSLILVFSCPPPQLFSSLSYIKKRTSKNFPSD